MGGDCRRCGVPVSVMRTGFLLLSPIVLSFLLVSCGLTSDEPQPTPTPTTRPRPTPTPLITEADIGYRLTTPAGNTIGVNFSPPLTLQGSDKLFEPEPGFVLRAAFVEACAATDAPPNTGILPSDFVVQMLDGSRWQHQWVEELQEKNPQLVPSLLAPGDCVTGSLGFVIPAGAVPRYVVYQGETLLKWAIPAQ